MPDLHSTSFVDADRLSHAAPAKKVRKMWPTSLFEQPKMISAKPKFVGVKDTSIARLVLTSPWLAFYLVLDASY